MPMIGQWLPPPLYYTVLPQVRRLLGRHTSVVDVVYYLLGWELQEGRALLLRFIDGMSHIEEVVEIYREEVIERDSACEEVRRLGMWWS
jgi:hypothetical protein